MNNSKTKKRLLEIIELYILSFPEHRFQQTLFNLDITPFMHHKEGKCHSSPISRVILNDSDEEILKRVERSNIFDYIKKGSDKMEDINTPIQDAPPSFMILDSFKKYVLYNPNKTFARCLVDFGIIELRHLEDGTLFQVDRHGMEDKTLLGIVGGL